MQNNPSSRKIFTIGEIVYDIVFKYGKAVSSNPGGAMLNTGVSLGRLGLPISLISELGMDNIGQGIIQFLKHNKVDTRNISRFNKGNTALALAFLDDNNNASYDFYKSYPTNRLEGKLPDVGGNDIVLFGSFFALSPEVREPLMKFLNQASKNGALIIYDPNIRKSSNISDLKALEFLAENIAISNIVRASDEDIINIDPKANSPEKAFEFIQKRGCNNLIYTQSNQKVDFITDKLSFSLPVPKIETISTIGAGDNFNAGLIYGLYNQNINMANFHQTDIETWKDIVKTAISFGSHVCVRMENYISKGFAQRQ